jgi:hypothetical protein
MLAESPSSTTAVGLGTGPCGRADSNERARLEIELHSSCSEDEDDEENDDEVDQEIASLSHRRQGEENAAILQAVQELLELQQSGGQESAEQVAKDKKMTKDLFERLLGKLESDQEIQRTLEYQIYTLEAGMKDKDQVIESFAEQAKEAMDECKGQAESMAEDLMTKIELEVSHRSDLEHLVRRLQGKLSLLQSELDVYRAAPNGAATVVELLQRSLAKNERQKRELAAVKQSRDAELRALGAACDVIEQQWSHLQCKYAAVCRELEDLKADQQKPPLDK